MSRETAGRVVLGLCAFTHDSAASLIVDGRLVGLVEEERLSGVKHTKEFPERAVAWLLKEANVTAQEVDLVGYNFAGHHYLAGITSSARYLLSPTTRSRAWARAHSFAIVHARYRRRIAEMRGRFPLADVRGVLHHRAHGLYAFAASGQDQAAVLIVDSLGETQTTTIGRAHREGDGVGYRIVEAIDDPASLGYVYGAVTVHLGWRRGDEEGTVMALAAQGDPEHFRSIFEEAIRLTPRGFAVDPAWFPLRILRHGHARVTPRFIEATSPPRRTDEPVLPVHADLAAALQQRTDEVMLHLAARARELTGARMLCLGGGVALNCVSVGKIAASGMFDEVSVPPAPGDSGTALGSALAVHHAQSGHLADGVAGRCYLGPAFPTPTPPDQPALRTRRIDAAAAFLADALAEGGIVGVFQGRLEAGPRALGNRSILASPLVPGLVERLNNSVKFREPFRPFAPVVLADHAEEYFVLHGPSPFMSIAVPVTETARTRIPAVVHDNGTARVQTVTADQNPLLAAILTAFAVRTGVPVLINTSLNIKGKPICGTPAMALECLTASGLDGLFLADGHDADRCASGSWVTKHASREPA